MEQLTIKKMQQMQAELQEKYKSVWGGLSPEKSKEMMLWLYGELGEASDVIKKNGIDKVLQQGSEVRANFIEEMCDVLMYFNDLLICFNVTPEEFESAYKNKFNKNLKRW